jgi:hypothetical protein
MILKIPISQKSGDKSSRTSEFTPEESLNLICFGVYSEHTFSSKFH